jgi:hypothetical protein
VWCAYVAHASGAHVQHKANVKDGKGKMKWASGYFFRFLGQDFGEVVIRFWLLTATL